MKNKFTKIDIKNGQMTYGQRLDLGKILSNEELSDLERFEQTFKCLYDRVPTMPQYLKLMPMYEEIVEGMVHWSNVESQMLYYAPTDKEVRGGIAEYQRNVGDMGPAVAMAKDFGYKPEEVLSWKYVEVFGILYADLEGHKFRNRMDKL